MKEKCSVYLICSIKIHLQVLLFVHSTVRSTAFTTKDIVVSGSDDRTVKVSVSFCVFCLETGVVIPDTGD